MNILQMSFTAAVMIAAVALLRALAINKLPKKVFLAFWAVVTLRLLIPFSIPSPLSVYSWLDEQPRITGAHAADVFPVTWLMEPSGLPAAPKARPAPAGDPALARDFVPVESRPAFPVWAALWFSGMTLCAAYFTVAYLRHYRRFHTVSAVHSGFIAQWLAGQKTLRPVRVWQSGKTSAPLTYGVFRPVILLPEGFDSLPEREMAYILAHEHLHIRRFDAVTKLALTAALCVHWFNPLVWLMFLLANRDLEITCDESVVRRFGAQAKSAYATALVSFEEKKNAYACYSGFGKSAAEERVKAVMKYKRASVISNVLAAVLLFSMTAVLLTACDESRYEPPFTVAPMSAGAWPPVETEKPIPVREPDMDLPDEWPAAYLPEDFPVMPHAAVENVRRENGEITMTVTEDPGAVSEYLVTKHEPRSGNYVSIHNFCFALMNIGYAQYPLHAPPTASYLGDRLFNQEGTVCDMQFAGWGPNREFKWKITVKFNQTFDFNTDFYFMDWPALDTDLGLEEIVFDEWPTEYLPKLFPAPVGMKPVSMVQLKNGVFITFIGSTGDYDSQIEKAGFKKYRNEGVGHPDYYKNPYVNSYKDRYYYIWDQADLDAIFAVLKSETEDEDVVAAIENINKGRKMVMQIIKGEDTERYWQSQGGQ